MNTVKPQDDEGGEPGTADGTVLRLLDRQVNDRALRQALAAAALTGTSAEAELERRLDALAEAIQQVHEPVALDRVLERVVGLISAAFGADRGSLFLYDADTDELYARVAQGELTQEIRFAADLGIAGATFRSGESLIVDDVHADPRFNGDIDLATGYATRNLLCVPVRTRRGEIIGVTEIMNRRDGSFTALDAIFLRAFATHVATALENARYAEQLLTASREESRLMDVTRAISSELDIEQLLRKIIGIATELLDAERSTLFLHDPARDELWSRVAEGLATREIRIPSSAGIAGECFTRREAIVIDDAYADPRFNPAIDRATGFRTRSVICVPVLGRQGAALGVVQVLNHRVGSFSPKDRRRLESLAAQSAIALENARLFREAVEARNYNENVLHSLTNGVVTLDLACRVVKLNEAATRLLGVSPQRTPGRSAAGLFRGGNAWIRRMIRRAARSLEPQSAQDAVITRGDGSSVAANVVACPLIDAGGRSFGVAVVIDDITREQRLRSMMARYMTREVAEQVIAQGDDALGGSTRFASILFADIAGFTSLAERLGPTGTVALLNDYLSEMVEVIFEHRGILDKYIGDAIMAVFGAPLSSPHDADNAVLTAIRMQQVLAQFNARRAARGEPGLDVRIGVNSDEVIAGNIGSARRMDYTVIGDGVNLAARLEDANRVYGTRALISASTVAQLRGGYALREIDLLRVRGRAQPVAVHEVFAAPPDERLLERYAAGLSAYRRADWHAAAADFAAALRIAPGDAPSAVMRRRALQFALRPPPAPWDGVFSDRGP